MENQQKLKVLLFEWDSVISILTSCKNVQFVGVAVFPLVNI